jgi:hypothetical protein
MRSVGRGNQRESRANQKQVGLHKECNYSRTKRYRVESGRGFREGFRDRYKGWVLERNKLALGEYVQGGCFVRSSELVGWRCMFFSG